MSLPGGHHVELNGKRYWLDEGYEDLTGRRCYVHGGRSIFAGRTDITGRPGSQNLKEDYLVWNLSQFAGEGQVVLDLGDADSAFRFYRSEGLNFRVPGQMSLNKSVLSETVSTTSSSSTVEGNAGFADISGTASTTNDTDRRLTAINTYVGESAAHTPGASNVQVNFKMYAESFATGATTIQGSAFNKVDGSPRTSGTDKILTRGDVVWSDRLSTGTELIADNTTKVQLFATVAANKGQLVRFQVIEVTGANDNAIVGVVESLESTSPSPFLELSWVPKANKVYRIKVGIPSSIEPTPVQVTLDKILYGNDVTGNTATIEIWDDTGAASLTTKTVNVDATASAVVGSISFQAAASTDYKARVKRADGKQALWLDAVTWTTLSAAAWSIDCLDFGLGQKVWLGAHASGADSRGFTYNTSTDVWDSAVTFNDGASTTNATVLAMAHSDSLEYFLLDSNEVYTSTSGGTDDRFAYFSTGAKTLVGMAVAQNRLILMSEDNAASTSVYIYEVPLDDTSTNPWDLNVAAPSTGVNVQQITAGAKTADTTLRQRMCSTPTGARFFINYAGVTGKIYQADTSDTGITVTELGDLGTGVQATAVCFENGITFVAGQYYGDATASDTDKLPRSALFAIDQNGIVNRIGFFRYDNPDPRPVEFMVPYQTSIYMLQGNYVWRYDLVSGGLFLEYQLSPATPSHNRALAVLFGRIFAAYSEEVFVAGSVGTYRQSSVADGSSYTSSIYDFGLPSVRKALAKIEVMTDTMPSNTQVQVFYQVDQSGTWVLAGTQSNGTIQTFFPELTTFSTLQVRVRLSTSDGASTPKFRGLTVWASAADDEEYFDLVVRTEDQDSSDHIANEQESGARKAEDLFSVWRAKAVVPFKDGYLRDGPGDDYLGTIEDIRIENNISGEGRAVLTFRAVR